MTAETKFPLVDTCCPACCRACDLNSHDYCLPCATSPYCSSTVEEVDHKKPSNGQDKGNGPKKGTKK